MKTKIEIINETVNYDTIMKTINKSHVITTLTKTGSIECRSRHSGHMGLVRVIYMGYTKNEAIQRFIEHWNSLEESFSQEELWELGWHFEPDERHECFELVFNNGQFQLQAVTEDNETYTVAHDTTSCGGREGIMDIIEIGDATFEYRWIGHSLERQN